jgi:prolyl-tRNA editing enzyme YbaK/EbsC (Cys-tRNA(Pro) deacylase)
LILFPLPSEQSTERVRNFILQKGLKAEIRILEPEATRTSELAAHTLGCMISEIAKTICFTFLEPDARRSVLVALSGDKRVNIQKASEFLGVKNLRKMNAEEVKRLTGYPIGGVPPFPQASEILIFADKSLLRFDHVWAAAGAPNAVMKIPTKLLSELSIPLADVSE